MINMSVPLFDNNWPWPCLDLVILEFCQFFSQSSLSYLCPPTLIFLEAKSTFLQSNVLIKMVKSSCKLWAYLTHLFPYEKIASSREKKSLFRLARGEKVRKVRKQNHCSRYLHQRTILKIS